MTPEILYKKTMKVLSDLQQTNKVKYRSATHERIFQSGYQRALTDMKGVLESIHHFEMPGGRREMVG